MMIPLIFVSCLILFSCSRDDSSISPEQAATSFFEASLRSDYTAMENFCAIPPDIIFSASMSSLSRLYSTPEEIYRTFAASYGFPTVPRNFEEYKKYYFDYTHRRFTEIYGNGYIISVSVPASRKLSEEETAAVILSADDYYRKCGIELSSVFDISSIEQCVAVSAAAYIKGNVSDDYTLLDSATIYTIFSNGGWKVLNMGLTV